MLRMTLGWLLLSALPGPGFELEASERRTISHMELEREYHLHIPPRPDANAPLPLIVALHGATMNGKQMEKLTGLSQLADKASEFAVAYPSANPTGRSGIWDFLSPRAATEEQSDSRIASGRDDLGFLSQLLKTLIKEGIADENRIYLTGMSNGAFFANRFMLEEPGRIAAAGLVAGTIPRTLTNEGKGENPIPLAYFHGTADEIVRINGSSFLTTFKLSLSAREYAEWWAARNGITKPEPETLELPDRDPSDGCRVKRLSWSSPSAPVIYYRIEGGGHTWPGGPKSQPTNLLGPIAKDIDASLVLWGFFRKFHLE